jgi:hypothetical protein
MLRALSFRTCGIILSLAVTTFAYTAHAQSDGATQSAIADLRWEEAGKAMDNKDYATACPKLEEVVRLRPDGLGAKLKLAKCYEGAGRLASAWAMYAQVEPLATRANQPDRQKTAHERMEALKPKLAMLTILVPDAVRALPGLEVTCDGKIVEAAQWGIPLPVDKGRHVIAMAAHRMPRNERVEEIEADGAVRTVTIEPPTGVMAPSVAEPPEPSRRSVAPAVVLGVLAAGGIASGIAFARLSASNYADAEAVEAALTASRASCVSGTLSYDAKLCSDLQAKANAYVTFHNVAVGAFIAGGAAAAGTALYLLWPAASANKTNRSVVHDVRLMPILSPTGNGLLVSGRF